MANGKLFIQNEAEYVIEVNHGTISIDLTDMALPNRLKAMYDKYNKGVENFANKTKSIDNLDDEQENEIGLTERKEAMIDSTLELIVTTYEAIDELFGEGASDKIFGNSKNITGLETFMELLPEQLEGAGLKSEEYLKGKLKKRSKYAPQDYKKKTSHHKIG